MRSGMSQAAATNRATVLGHASPRRPTHRGRASATVDAFGAAAARYAPATNDETDQRQKSNHGQPTSLVKVIHHVHRAVEAGSNAACLGCLTSSL